MLSGPEHEAGSDPAASTPTCATASLAIEQIDVDQITLTGRGRFDARAAEYLRHRLTRILRAGVRDLALDLTAVSHIDSAGFEPIEQAATTAHDLGGRLVVTGLGVTPTEALAHSRRHHRLAPVP